MNDEIRNFWRAIVIDRCRQSGSGPSGLHTDSLRATSAHKSGARPKLIGAFLIILGLLVPITATHAKEVLDLERLTGLQAQKMMQDGDLTSVQLTRAYIDRIEALNKRGPGLNAVTQLNPNALKEAEASDKRRAMGHLLGPADGLPILMKDLIDVKDRKSVV